MRVAANQTVKSSDSPRSSESFDVLVNVSEFEEAPGELIERAVRCALSAEARGVGEISVTLLSDNAITVLNRDYLSKDRPTDVIAFSLGERDQIMGDVYIGFDQAVRQARDEGVSLDEELARLAIHGTLHLLGHDHPDGPERTNGPMFALQERLLRELLA